MKSGNNRPSRTDRSCASTWGTPHDRKCHYAATVLCGVVSSGSVSISLHANHHRQPLLGLVVFTSCRFPQTSHSSVTQVCSPKSISIASLKTPRGFMHGHSARASSWLVVLYWFDVVMTFQKKDILLLFSPCFWVVLLIFYTQPLT